MNTLKHRKAYCHDTNVTVFAGLDQFESHYCGKCYLGVPIHSTSQSVTWACQKPALNTLKLHNVKHADQNANTVRTHVVSARPRARTAPSLPGVSKCVPLCRRRVPLRVGGYGVPCRGLPWPCVQVLFETDDLATALWAELLAVLLRFKRPPPHYPPYLVDTWRRQKNGTWKNLKGLGGFVRGACLVKPTLGQDELDFIKAALPHMDMADGMCEPRPPENCLTTDLVTESARAHRYYFSKQAQETW